MQGLFGIDAALPTKIISHGPHMNDNSPQNTGHSAPFGHLTLQNPEAVDYKLEIAGIGARSHAFVIDWHIRLLLALAWLIACGYLLALLQGIEIQHWSDAPSVLVMIWLVPAAVIFFLYHPLLEILMSGRTPGKRMAGVRLVTLDGRAPDAGAILVRNVFRLIDSLPGFYAVGLACVALTRHQVRIGDMAAGLLLVYDNTVNAKTLSRATDLALHSHLPSDEQTLLLDLLERWPQLNVEGRIRLGARFLERTGHPVPEQVGKQSVYAKEILRQLERLSGSER